MNRSIRLRSPLPTIVGLVFALGWPLLFLLIPSQTHQNVTDARQDLQIIVIEWTVTLVLVGIVVFWERLPFAASVGLRKLQWFDATAAVALALLGSIAMIAIVAFALHLKTNPLSNVNPTTLAALPFPLRLALVLTAGYCEETLFRGYAIERLTALSGRLWIGVVGAVVFFTLGHVARYGFSVVLVGVATIAVFLSLLYAWRRSLWPCIIMHWIIDGLPLLVFPLVKHP